MHTPYRCCPVCGAELAFQPSEGCGCTGPFTAEEVDPMHIRPYAAKAPSPSATAPLPDGAQELFGPQQSAATPVSEDAPRTQRAPLTAGCQATRPDTWWLALGAMAAFAAAMGLLALTLSGERPETRGGHTGGPVRTDDPPQRPETRGVRDEASRTTQPPSPAATPGRGNSPTVPILILQGISGFSWGGNASQDTLTCALEWTFSLLDVLTDPRQRCAAAAPGEVGTGPEYRALPHAVDATGVLGPQGTTG